MNRLRQRVVSALVGASWPALYESLSVAVRDSTRILANLHRLTPVNGGTTFSQITASGYRQDTERRADIYDEYIQPGLAPVGALLEHLVAAGRIRDISLSTYHFVVAYGAAAAFTLTR
jgi:hypothetical protein